LSDILNTASTTKQLKKNLDLWTTTFGNLHTSSSDYVIKKLAEKFAVSQAS